MKASTREVKFHVGPFSMYGQIDYPDEDDIYYPLVFIIPAKPPHDRYGNVRGYPGYENYFEPIVEQLLRLNYAVFRFDKGGTGKSSSGLSVTADTVAAFRKACQQENIDLTSLYLLVLGGGSAIVFRTWLELTQINPIHSICFLSTGLNDLKLEDFTIPICLIANSENFLRSRNALERYRDKTNQPVGIYEIRDASEQLCDEKYPVSLFKKDGCKWHPDALDAISQWFSGFEN